MDMWLDLVLGARDYEKRKEILAIVLGARHSDVNCLAMALSKITNP
jgi:hypothetical protein